MKPAALETYTVAIAAGFSAGEAIDSLAKAVCDLQRAGYSPQGAVTLTPKHDEPAIVLALQGMTRKQRSDAFYVSRDVYDGAGLCMFCARTRNEHAFIERNEWINGVLVLVGTYKWCPSV